MDIVLTDEQNKAKNKFIQWFRQWNYSNSKPYFFISGYAGTGKSTLMKYILNEVNVPFQIGTFTGKAAINVKKRTGLPCKTIHSLLYTPVVENGKIIDWELNLCNKFLDRSKLIVIDEISMVSKDIWNDLLLYRKPVLVFGDLGQLPPVSGEQIFTFDNADFTLQQIHRQALENPIIRLSVDVRKEKDIPYGNFDNLVMKAHKSDFDMKNLLNFNQIVCGTNRTRKSGNNFIRELKGYSEYKLPVRGEKLVCLQNNKEMKVFNGQIFNTMDPAYDVLKSRGTFKIYLNENEDDDSTIFRAEIFDDEFVRNEIREDRWKIQKSDPKIIQADFSYFLTCHKSQGSQWRNVCVFDESDCFREDKWRWLYTAITRCEEKMLILK